MEIEPKNQSSTPTIDETHAQEQVSQTAGIEIAARESIGKILDYLWEAELRDYLALSTSDRTGHIFEAMERVDRWLSEPRPIRKR